MHHYVYQVENLLNHKIYIGKHSTENLDDGYMGSGKLLGKAIAKYGLENFRKTILQTFDTCEEALTYEKLLVTEEFAHNQNTYNLTVGGGDGWWTINIDVERRREKNHRAALSMNKTLWSDPEFRKRTSVRVSAQSAYLHEQGKLSAPDWTGKKHSDATRAKMRDSHTGKHVGQRNSQFATVWVFNLEERRSLRIKNDELDAYLKRGWHKGRKIKW
jgi:hypothetical protein